MLRRVLALLCLLAAGWTVLVALTGGFRVYLGSVRISSRDVWNPLATTAICGGAVWALSVWLGTRGSLHQEWSWWKRLAAAAPALAARHLTRYQNLAPTAVIGLIVAGL